MMPVMDGYESTHQIRSATWRERVSSMVVRARDVAEDLGRYSDDGYVVVPHAGLAQARHGGELVLTSRMNLIHRS